MLNTSLDKLTSPIIGRTWVRCIRLRAPTDHREREGWYGEIRSRR